MREGSFQEMLGNKNLFNALEVASLLEIKPHVIRYWESEFSEIRPQKNKDGMRLYRREDLILFYSIKQLLCDKKFTIAAARKILRDKNSLQSTIYEENNANLPIYAENTLEEASMYLSNLETPFDSLIPKETVKEEKKELKEEVLKKETFFDYDDAISNMKLSKETLMNVLEEIERPSLEVWQAWEEHRILSQSMLM